MQGIFSRRKRVLLNRVRESWQWWLLLLPAFIYVAIFEYGPMYGVQIAFRDYRARDGIIGSEWIGLEHFFRFVSTPNFYKMIRNTLSITLYSLATFPCPIIFALMLNEVYQIKLKKSMQMITYAPHFMSEVVVCSLVWMMLDRANGPINNILSVLGGERIPFLTVPQYFSSIYVWSGVWQNLGWSSILYISALSSISPELVEAANIDSLPAKTSWLRGGYLDQNHPRAALYDLLTDPVERINRADDPAFAEARGALEQKLSAWMRKTDDPLLRYPNRVPKPTGANINLRTCTEPGERLFEA